MKGKLPVSKAKTAYGLLSEIAALAIEEPKRITMGSWLSKASDDLPSWRLPEKGYPSCRTVGCVAGWAITLKPTRARVLTDFWGLSRREDESDRASRLLGLGGARQSRELFLPGRLINAAKQQTPEHANAVVAHIRKFQKKYKAQLLAKKV